ncbi:MAG: VCBS repeat-containing protein [Verrucomicrobiales bacterium]|nr:VCBS repeat-containing protein [Verrucomicrobiales bacterium]
MAFCGLTALASTATAAGVPTFQRNQLSNQFWAEGAGVGDFNHDGVMDVVSGPFWWEGPDFTRRHQFGAANETFQVKKADGTEETIPGFEGGLGKNNAYSKNFLAFGRDINQDGWDDILILGFPGEKSSWYENPKGASVLWKEHVALEVTDNESPAFLDITGDGRPEIVCASKGTYGYATPDPKDPTRPWTWHAVSPNNNYHKFTHGMGVGDINGDGRSDLMEKDGWWEQPASLAGDPVWKFHKFPFGVGGSQMFAYDVNGDGLNDVITGLSAHGYGLAWFEQVRTNGDIGFREHVFMNKEPSENPYGVKFSQLHAVDLVDINGDGLKDIITGKRFWAHGPAGDPEPGAPPVLYWWELVRRPDKSVDWVPHLIDDNSGVGTQVMARDLNGDRRPDIVVGNKRGVFVFTQQ